MRRLVGFSLLTLTLTCSPLRASTITFERDLAPKGAVTYSSTNAAVTITNWGIGGLYVSDGTATVHYDVDGPLSSSLDPGGVGAMELFIDGCVPVVSVFLIVRYDCTPTVASYIQIVGSIPDLGIPLQSLMIGTFIGGAPDSFSPPNFAALDVTGGGSSSTLSLPLSQALGLDPATQWQFTMVVHFGFQPPPLKEDQIILTGQSFPSPFPNRRPLACSAWASRPWRCIGDVCGDAQRSGAPVRERLSVEQFDAFVASANLLLERSVRQNQARRAYVQLLARYRDRT